MQIHMRRLVEVIKDIDGFKELRHDNHTIKFNTGGLCHYGKRIKRERILQTDDY